MWSLSSFLSHLLYNSYKGSVAGVQFGSLFLSPSSHPHLTTSPHPLTTCLPQSNPSPPSSPHLPNMVTSGGGVFALYPTHPPGGWRGEWGRAFAPLLLSSLLSSQAVRGTLFLLFLPLFCYLPHPSPSLPFWMDFLHRLWFLYQCGMDICYMCVSGGEAL